MGSNEQELKKELERLKKELEQEKQKNTKPRLYLKVSEKGAVSLYGIRSKFPITFYMEEWLRILDMDDEIREFLAENEERLARKDRKR